MKKLLLYFLFCFLLLISSKIVAQENNLLLAKQELENLVFIADSTKIENIQNEKFQNISEISKFSKIVSRDIDFGLKKLVYNFTFSYRNNHSFNYNYPEVHLYYFNENPVGIIINYKGKSSEHKYKFHSEFQIFLNSHNSFYNSKKDLKGFIDDTLNKTIYGNYCGYEMKALKKVNDIKLYSIENVEKYAKWMKSFNLELQMWGYDQLDYLMKEKSIEFENDEEKIFNYIRKRNSILETCSGCEFGLYKRIW